MGVVTGGQGEGGRAGSEPPHGPQHAGGHDKVTGQHSHEASSCLVIASVCMSVPRELGWNPICLQIPGLIAAEAGMCADHCTCADACAWALY